MSWRVWSVSTLDWSTRVMVSPETFPWKRALNGGAGGQATFQLGDSSVAETANDETMAPWERMLVAEFQGQIVYAGFIISADYDMDTQTLTVSHEDLWAVLSRRLMAGLVADGVQTTALIYTGVTLQTFAREAIYEGQNDAARFNLPIVIPPSVPGPESKTFYGYHLPTVASVLNDTMSAQGGPDIDFYPRWHGDGVVEWYLRMGNLVDGIWEWDVTAPKSPAFGLRQRLDGSQMANRIAALGEGSEKKMLVSVADGSATSSFLPLDAAPAYKDESDQARLAGRAQSDLTVRARPTRQIGMNVWMDADFAAHQILLGGTVRWKTQGDPYFPDGWKSSRIIEFSGDLSNRIHLEFQTAGGA